jgi:hypothetical protein
MHRFSLAGDSMKSDRGIINEQSWILRNAEIPTGPIDDEMVALDLDRGECFGMDGIGALIWQMAADPIRVCELIDRFACTHAVARDECLADVLTFLEELRGAGLVRVLPG